MNIDYSALCYLADWDRGNDPPGGLARSGLLRLQNLDYSVASLGRIDDFLDQVRREDKPNEYEFLNRADGQNLLYFLAFYAGEVIARSWKSAQRWENFEQARQRSPGIEIFGDSFYSSAIVSFPKNTTTALSEFLPLNALSERLFSDKPEKSIFLSSGLMLPSEYKIPPLLNKPLPPVPSCVVQLDIQAMLEKLNDADLELLEMIYPEWAKDDALRRLFDCADELLRQGKITWGAVVQVNSKLFYPEFIFGAPGEIIYDPLGRMQPESLKIAAHSIFELKGETFTNADLNRYSKYLADEYKRVFGWDVPREICPYPLKVSTTFFDQSLLPDGMLSLNWLPLLVNDRFPGVVRPLPSVLWHEDFKTIWLRAGRETHGQNFDVRETRREPIQEYAIYMHNKGVLAYRDKDWKGAKYFFGESAKLGDACSLDALGTLLLESPGNEENEGKMLDCFRRSARKGFAPSQVNLARILLKREGGIGVREEAAYWLELAAAQGDKEANQLLKRNFPPRNKSIFGMWLGSLLRK